MLFGEIDKNALDRHITGNWGEDQHQEPEMRLVYIREQPEPRDGSPWHIFDAHTDENLMQCADRHGAVDYCVDQNWDVRDGPVGEEEGMDDTDHFFEDYPDDDPGFDPMFLM